MTQKQFQFTSPPECPVFKPNEKEFENPFTYINKIRPVAEEFGICKIKPPKTWVPPFSICLDKFIFEPRIQHLNRIDAQTRVKRNFLEQISKFWKNSLCIPKDLDLYKLYHAVKSEGGIEVLTEEKWSKIALHLNHIGENSGTIVKKYYEKILHPFDIFTSGTGIMTNGCNVSNEKIKLDLLAKCQRCNRAGTDDEKVMLLCNDCDDSYHTHCLIPPPSDIPQNDWKCPKCIVKMISKIQDEFGFDQSQRKYNLEQFCEMADEFKTDYFKKPAHTVKTDFVEREFWRIVSSIDEDVIVEYGTDLRTTELGSGFPTKESLNLNQRDQKYVESGWNLNNLPLLEESILSHTNADISGMKNPWMYIGMCFATFCWHVEDHWSYSINYLHLGEPKTWYGIPGYKAEAFEKTIKSVVPELFQSQPHLLDQLVTIVNPNILMNSNIPVYRTDQCEREFIITFPKAYHAGFNQGFNFAESVNLTPADWIQVGRECISYYATEQRLCVFSLDEVVCKMSLNCDHLNFEMVNYCYQDMIKMVLSERKLRKSLCNWGVTKHKKIAFELIPDDKRQCNYCKTTCFLSAVACLCKCTKSVIVCLRHHTELCDCPANKHVLLYKYNLDELYAMLEKLKAKLENFENCTHIIKNL